ncbi:MAG: anthranilate synthase component I, partial [Planctomyces sp.]|nr:anthranilate synthase component I [Planctomyces sp.]
MSHLPSFDQFKALAGPHRLVPVYRQLVSDSLTPVGAYTLLPDSDYSFLFESVVGGEKIGRYSFLGSSPFLTLEAYRQEIVVTDHQTGNVERYTVEDPLDELDKRLKQYQACHLPGLPRFCGGAVGYAGYDVVRYTENLPNAPKDDRELPDYSFSFHNEMIVFDQINKTILVVTHARTDGGDLQGEYKRACARVDQLCDQLRQPVTGLSLSDITRDGQATLKWKSNFKQEEFEAAVEKCKEYITAGDIFQVVLSQRLELETKAKPLDIYRSLRVVNPSPFMFLLNTPSCQLVGSSPEIMVRTEDGLTTVRPLAGTRPRGKTAEEDAALAADLLADPKECAEHVMLIDLARNDIGRVAQFGSVKLSDVMVVERYSHVMHITSNVTGQLVEGKTA